MSRLLVAAVAVSGIFGCGTEPPAPGTAGEPAAGSSSTGTAESAVGTGVAREVAVYAAAIRHHLSSVAEPMPAVVYVLDRAVPDAANPMRRMDDEDGVAIGQQTRDQLSAQLAGLARVSFIASWRSVLTTVQICPTVDQNGVVLTLAPVPAGVDRVELGLVDFRTCLNARWQTYVLVSTPGGWVVTGTTGPMAIS
jgi:hypothetical protein